MHRTPAGQALEQRIDRRLQALIGHAIARTSRGVGLKSAGYDLRRVMCLGSTIASRISSSPSIIRMSSSPIAA
jgi:hypothetical protein